MAVYALNLFDLADNADYLAYSRQSPKAVARYGGRVIALGHHGAELIPGATPARNALVLVEWPNSAAIRAYLDDPEFTDLHPLREGGTLNYLWWSFDKLDDLRPLLTSR
jgi:uncharacterized protein (DUF1330 family)